MTLIEEYGIGGAFLIGRVSERFKQLTEDHQYRSKWRFEEFYNGWLEGRIELLRELEEKRKEKNNTCNCCAKGCVKDHGN